MASRSTLGTRCASGLAQPASAGGGGTREILATARPQRESAAPYDLLLLVMEVVASGGRRRGAPRGPVPSTSRGTGLPRRGGKSAGGVGRPPPAARGSG